MILEIIFTAFQSIKNNKMNDIPISVWIYIILAISHFAIMTALAIYYHKKHKKVFSTNANILLIIPTFNERKDLLKRTIESSIIALSNIQSKIVVVNNAKLEPIYFQDLRNFFGNKVSLVNSQQGKREAQKFGFDFATKNNESFDYVMTIDSDTILDPKCIQSFIGQYELDKKKKVGAITGNVLAILIKGNGNIGFQNCSKSIKFLSLRDFQLVSH